MALLTSNEDTGVIYEVGVSRDCEIHPGDDGLLFCPNAVDGRPIARPHEPYSLSHHCWENITEFRHFSVKMHSGADLSLRALLVLPLAIVSITRCSVKTINAVVRVPGTDTQFLEQWSGLAGLLTRLSVGWHSMKPTSLCRLPQVRRGDGVQELLYFDPSPSCEPIYPLTGAE